MDSGDPARSPWRDFSPNVRRPIGRVFEDKQDRDALVQLLRRPALWTVGDRGSGPPRPPPSSDASTADGAKETPVGPPWEGPGRGGGGVDDDSTGNAGSNSNPKLEGTESQVTDLPVDCVEESVTTGRRHRRYSPVSVRELERHFQRNPYPRREEIVHLELVTKLEYQKIRVWFQNRRARERRLLRRVGFSPDFHKSHSWTTSGTVHHIPTSSSLTSSCGVSSCASIHGTPILRSLLDPNNKAVSSLSNLPAYCFSTTSSNLGQHPEHALQLQSSISGQNYASYRPNFYGARTDSPMRERHTAYADPAYAAGGYGYDKNHSWHRPYADGRLNEYSTAYSDLSYRGAMSHNWNRFQGPHSSCTAGLSSRNMSACRVLAGFVPEESGCNYGMPFGYPVVNWNYVGGTTENCFQLMWNASNGTANENHEVKDTVGKPCELVNWNAVSGNPFVAVQEENLAFFSDHQQPDWCALYRCRDVGNARSIDETEKTSQVDHETNVLEILLEKEKEEIEVFSRTIIVEPDSTVNHYFGYYNEMQDCREGNVPYVSQPVPNSQTANFDQPFETVLQDGSNMWNWPASHISCTKPYRNFQMISEVQRVYKTENRLVGGNFPSLLPIVADVHQNDLFQVVQNTSMIARLQYPHQMVHDHRWNGSSSSCLTNWHHFGNGNLSLDVQNSRSIVHSKPSLHVSRALPQYSMHQGAPVHGFPAPEWNWAHPTSRFHGYLMDPPHSSYVQNQNGWNQQNAFDFSNGMGFQSSSLPAMNQWSDVGSSGVQLAEATTECNQFVEPVVQQIDQEMIKKSIATAASQHQ